MGLATLAGLLAAVVAGSASPARFAPRGAWMDVPGERDLSCSWDYVARQRVVTCALRRTVPSYRVAISDRYVRVYRSTGRGRSRLVRTFVHPRWRNRPFPKRVPPRRPPPARRFVFPKPEEYVFLPNTDIVCQWERSDDSSVQCRLDRIAITYAFFISRTMASVLKIQPGYGAIVPWRRNHDGTIPGP